MAPLYWTPTIVYGGTRLYLPPWVKVSVKRAQKVDLVPVPETNTAIIPNMHTNQGTRIGLSISYRDEAPTQRAILDLWDTLWSNLTGRQFDLFLFNDRAWEDCALESQEEEIGLEPLLYFDDMPLDIVCPHTAPNTSLQLTFDNFATDYPYADKVGRPLGDAITPGETLIVGQPSMQTFTPVFPGVQNSPASSGDEHRIIVGGTAGKKWVVDGLQIINADKNGATGTTVVVLATYAIGELPGSFVSCSVASNASFGSRETSSIEVTTGDTLYLYVSSGGGHQNVQVSVQLRSV